MSSVSGAVFQLGKCLAVPMTLHAKNRARLVTALREKEGVAKDAVVFLGGGLTPTFHDTDHEPVFRQEAFFHWAFGVKEPDCVGAISVASGEAVLFIPRLPEVYATWMGHIKTTKEVQGMYDVEHCKYTDEVKSVLEEVFGSIGQVLTLKGPNSDSGSEAIPASFDGLADLNENQNALHPVITSLRTIKTEEEVEVMRWAAKKSCEAHRRVMKDISVGSYEFQSESLFKHHCYSEGGMRNMSYTCIGGSGHNCSVLHYGHSGAANDKGIQDGDMCLFDMGGEYHRYASDITCSFPANGKFNDDQKMIYNTVLKANLDVQKAMRPGVQYTDMHLLAERTILEGLKAGGLLTGEVDDMMEVALAAVFQPHGLGHLIGIDTHDCGGWPAGTTRPTRPGLKSLRCGLELADGMAVTVEPGVYFINHLLNEALANEAQAKFLVKEKIESFRGFGGVRIEDDVIVRPNGVDNLSADVPRTVEEIEAWMA